jgi:bacilysin biosynthesis oxidoreductase BacG
MENDKFRERLRRDVPAQRLGEPSETAELALFLASDNSSFIYGQIISNDGGWS